MILVTGGCGFVGSNLVKLLVDQGHEVRVLDNLSKGRKSYLSGLDVDIYEADIRDPKLCEDAFSDVKKVVHLAAFGSVVESVDDPQANFDMNVVGTFNILKLCVQKKVKKMVFSSTGGALIGNANPPVDEGSLPKPISPYGASKLCCESYCHAFAESYGLNTVCLRFANVYGPNSEHKTGVINKYFEAIKKGAPLLVYGDGESSRDYIHVSDLVRGISIALMDDSLENEVLHLATGTEITLKRLADTVKEVSGRKDHPIEYLPSRPGEVNRNFASYDYAKKKIGFEPKVSLKKGLEALWDHWS